jgi:hypothetical protein
MLQRRNTGKNGVSKIGTVSLPFTPFTLRQPLACLLAAESVELPPLASLSLEATREVMFDSTVYVHISYRGGLLMETKVRAVLLACTVCGQGVRQESIGGLTLYGACRP